MYATTYRRLIHPYGCPTDIALTPLAFLATDDTPATDAVHPADELRVIREWADGPGRHNAPDTVANVIVQMIDNLLAGRQATDNGGV